MYYQRQVSFEEAVRMALQQNYCNFSGRASRSEYWWFTLFSFVVSIIASSTAIFSDTFSEILSCVVGLGLLLPGLGVAVRRLHDIGKSGWYLLLGLIPLVGGIILLVWYCQNSQNTANEYGPVPNVVEG